MTKLTGKENVLKALMNREYFQRDHYRKNLQILSTLICRGNYEFRKVWEQSSKQFICCGSNNIFLDNYRKAYNGYSCGDSAPVHNFTISQEKMPRKIVDAILSRRKPAKIYISGPCCSVLQIISEPFETNVSSPLKVTKIYTSGPWTQQPGNRMFALTADTFLIVDLKSGRVRFEMLLLLSHLVKFKHINWMIPEESVCLSTTLCPRVTHTPGHRPLRPGHSNLVKVLAVFNIDPLQFLAMFEVNRQIFGSDVTDAIMCPDLLVVMHQNNRVRFYDFQHLLDIHKIEPQLMKVSRYGDRAPLGLNMKITELPRCLFEIRCAEWNVQMGGHPWHYLVSPVGSRGIFNVYSLEKGDLADNGSIKSFKDSIEMDRAVFHRDDSSRIIHIGPEDVRVFLLEQSEGSSVLLPAFTITLNFSLPDATPPPPVFTSSGRQVKRRFSVQDLTGESMCTTIHEVDYEDELDVLMVTSTVHQSNRLQGTVGLYHNTTGQLLTTVTLEEPWQDYAEHNVTLDKDTIMHILKSPNGKYLIQVYRLFERRPDDEGPAPGGCSEGRSSLDSHEHENPEFSAPGRRRNRARSGRRPRPR